MLRAARPQLWSAQYLLALFGTFSFFACFFYLTTALPSELVGRGASALEIGLVVGGYSLIPIFLRPFVGRWSDGGKRILLMRIGLLTFIGSFALMIFVNDIWVLFALRCVHGLGMGTYPTAAGSFVAEIVPTSRRGEGLGFFGLSTSASQTVFPMLGGLIFAYLGGFDAVLIVAIVTAGASFALTFLKREPRGSGQPPPPLSLRSLIPPPAVFPMFVFLSITLTFSVAAAFLPSLEDADPNRNFGGAEGIGIFFFLFSGLGAMVTRPMAGRISDIVGRVPVIIPGLIATVAGLVTLTQADTVLMLIPAGLLTGVGMGAAHTGLLALAVDRVAPTQRGGATATFQLAWDIGGFVAGPILAIVGQLLSVEMVFWAAAVFSVFALVTLLYGRAMGWTRPHPALAASGA